MTLMLMISFPPSGPPRPRAIKSPALPHTTVVAPSRCLDAVTVALGEAYDGEGWYASTLQLQLVSWSFCEACRAVPTLRVTVDPGTPRRMWAAPAAAPAAAEVEGTSRSLEGAGTCQQARVLPPLRPFGVTWHLRGPALKGVSRAFGERLVELVFGPDFNDRVQDIEWPGKRLRSVTFGEETTHPVTLEALEWGHFDRSIEGVPWPASLESLTFMGAFNQPLGRVVWPPSLKELTLSRIFNRPIADVRWPDSLKRLTFNWSFDQSMEGITLPPSLQELNLSHLFNQPIAGVTWPKSLKSLIFQGGTFNQPINKVAWPPRLKSISFGHHFNQPLAEASWPSSLKYLSLGVNFNQPLQDVVWPPRIHKLGFPATLKDEHLAGVAWPESLQELVFSEPDPTGDGHKIQRIPWPASSESVAVPRELLAGPPSRPRSSAGRAVSLLIISGFKGLPVVLLVAVIAFRFWQLDVAGSFGACCDASASAVVCLGCSLAGLAVLSFWTLVGAFEVMVAGIVLGVSALFLAGFQVERGEFPGLRLGNNGGVAAVPSA